MKSTVLTLLISFLVASVSVAQNQIIVDNNTNGIGDHTEIGDALSNAQSGDVILVIPSPNTYGDITLTSGNITIAGGGANGQNGDYTLLGTISISAGLQNITLGGFRSGNITATGGVNKIKGLNLQGIYVDGNVSLSSIDSLKLGFVRTVDFTLATSNNVVMYHNEFTGTFNIATTQDFIVSNSLLNVSGITVDNESKGLFNNNNIEIVKNYVTVTLNFGATVNATNNWIRMVSNGYGMVISGGAVFQYNALGNNYGFHYITLNSNFGTITASSAQSENEFRNFALPSNGGDATTYTDKGVGVDADGTTANIGYTGGLNPMPSELPSVAKGVSVVPSITSLQLSLPTAATNGSVILNVTGKSKRN